MTALNVAKWFLARNRVEEASGADGISNLKLQKLLYYAQGCTLAITGKPLFDDDILAWKHGPVVENVCHEYKSFGSNSIADTSLDFGEMPDNISDILENVYKSFGQYSAWKLRDMTHEETPWKETAKNEVIQKGTIKKYFEENYIDYK